MEQGVKNTTEQVREYWNKASCGTGRTRQEKFSLQYFEEIEAFRYTHEPFIRSFAEFEKWAGQKVLEIGVGAGTDFLQFVRANAETYGVDLTKEAIANVTHRLDVYGLKAAGLRCCNAEKLPFANDTFDLVYSWGVLHHAADMEQAFAEAYRVARPGGRIKIMMYNLDSLRAWYLFARHALPRGRLVRGRQWAIWRYQESFATKAYRLRDIRQLLSAYDHEAFSVNFRDQKIRQGARFETLRRLLYRLTPRRMRWYMAFEFTKADASAQRATAA